MRKRLLLRGFLITATVVGVLAWQLASEDSSRSDPLVERVKVFMYRPPLGPNEQPSGFMKHSQVVALVTVTDIEEPRWNTPSGRMPGGMVLPNIGDWFIYTPVVVKADSYIKGAGPETLRISQLSGSRDGITFELASPEGYNFTPGMRAVVFLNPPGINVNGWTLENAYIITGSRAFSQWDQRELPVEDLLAQLRAAAAAERQP